MNKDLRTYVSEAQEIASQVDDPELRKEAFKLVLQHLMENRNRIQAEIEEPKPETTNSDLKDSPGGIPAIHPSESTSENIRSLFSNDWGRQRRMTTEVSKALDANGVPDTKHVSTILNRLVQSRYLLRRKENDTFTYWKNPSLD